MGVTVPFGDMRRRRAELFVMVRLALHYRCRRVRRQLAGLAPSLLHFDDLLQVVGELRYCARVLVVLRGPLRLELDPLKPARAHLDLLAQPIELCL